MIGLRLFLLRSADVRGEGTRDAPLRIGTLRYPGRGGKENVGLPEKAWSEDAANLAGETN